MVCSTLNFNPEAGRPNLLLFRIGSDDDDVHFCISFEVKQQLTSFKHKSVDVFFKQRAP